MEKEWINQISRKTLLILFDQMEAMREPVLSLIITEVSFRIEFYVDESSRCECGIHFSP